MILALAVCSVVCAALLWEAFAPALAGAFARWRTAGAGGHRPGPYDPGRERRAEARARELLRSCVHPDDWEMYRQLGFLRVWGGMAEGGPAPASAPYAYLIYPHRPIVAYVPQTMELLSEYCVEFPDLERPYGSSRLPDSDDVLAKWIGLTGDERHLIARANMHLPGRQVDPDSVRGDLWRLARWEQARLRPADSVPAP